MLAFWEQLQASCLDRSLAVDKFQQELNGTCTSDADVSDLDVEDVKLPSEGLSDQRECDANAFHTSRKPYNSGILGIGGHNCDSESQFGIVDNSSMSSPHEVHLSAAVSVDASCQGRTEKDTEQKGNLDLVAEQINAQVDSIPQYATLSSEEASESCPDVAEIQTDWQVKKGMQPVTHQHLASAAINTKAIASGQRRPMQIPAVSLFQQTAIQEPSHQITDLPDKSKSVQKDVKSKSQKDNKRRNKVQALAAIRNLKNEEESHAAPNDSLGEIPLVPPPANPSTELKPLKDKSTEAGQLHDTGAHMGPDALICHPSSFQSPLTVSAEPDKDTTNFHSASRKQVSKHAKADEPESLFEGAKVVKAESGSPGHSQAAGEILKQAQVTAEQLASVSNVLQAQSLRRSKIKAAEQKLIGIAKEGSWDEFQQVR